jgi:S-adenosyl-L-methionine hydrolase (adenosine-forming)
MISLCTDFGRAGPYVGQVEAVLARAAPGVPVIDLFADLPACAPQLAALPSAPQEIARPPSTP